MLIIVRHASCMMVSSSEQEISNLSSLHSLLHKSPWERYESISSPTDYSLNSRADWAFKPWLATSLEERQLWIWNYIYIALVTHILYNHENDYGVLNQILDYDLNWGWQNQWVFSLIYTYIRYHFSGTIYFEFHLKKKNKKRDNGQAKISSPFSSKP